MKLRRCSCGTYTFKQSCPACGGATVFPQPASFTPADPYGAYRRAMKEDARKRT